ncbi:hypothetical protein N7474_009033 [Penicillium riverlandense]|uniref:uncharacterized protein n=1 Tax=Penicillium riverlandense TaxID=1903569 RepID=UPI00254780BC|nr:uncharacterized protein N7474_009033 [Penicillium riverlandense]KAJ5807764.1 hypothetical protein N7474_009033 [Penicillium riverlandense]
MSSQFKEDSQIVVPLEGVSDGNEDFWPEEGTTRYETADTTNWCRGLAMMWMRDIGVLGEIDATRNMVPVRARQRRDRSVPTDVDVLRVAIANMKTKAPETIDELIEERMNMDWRFTNDHLAEYFEMLTLQPAFLPRHGETVLWTPLSLKPGEYLQFNPDTEALMVRNDKGEWVREPKWFAGIITQTPLEEILCQEIITPEDREPGNSASNKGPKDWTSSLFRVEALPHPIEDDKSDSLFNKYLPLSCIKPFGFWQCFLHNIPRDKWDPSIENAMITMSSWSVVSRYRFKGTWPNASIFCQGIWIGAELLAVGDRVRLRPLSRDGTNLSQVTDVMVIETIEVHLKDCIDDPDDEHLADQYSSRIKGKIYTLDKNRPDTAVFGNIPLQSMSMEEVATALNLNIMNKYGHWYRVAEGKTAVVSQDMILGRCYEPDAHLFHWGNHNLGNDLPAILAGRDYSRIADARMPERSTWFWGDYRAETLGLESVNGYDVGVAAEQRRDPNLDVEYDPDHPIHMRPWLAVFRILDGQATPTDARDARLPRKRGRPFKKDSDLQKLGKTSKLISTGLGQVSNDDDDEEEEEEEEENAKEEEKNEMEIKEEKKVKSESGKRQRVNGAYTVRGNVPGNAIPVDSEEESEAESSSSEEDDPFGGQPQPLYFRGGTEETELGDYQPGN